MFWRENKGDIEKKKKRDRSSISDRDKYVGAGMVITLRYARSLV
jgi:hypothetical protein